MRRRCCGHEPGAGIEVQCWAKGECQGQCYCHQSDARAESSFCHYYYFCVLCVGNLGHSTGVDRMGVTDMQKLWSRYVRI